MDSASPALYSIQAEYQQKIDQLQADIAELQTSRDDSMRQVLSTEQREMLGQLSKPKTKPVSTKQESKRSTSKKQKRSPK